ncbi:MAG: cupin domain-containing protein [Rhodobacterales bacterium]|nr:cupin domain-containing protein [Rhodobacterales bacterium]
MPVIKINELAVTKGEESVGYPAPHDKGCDLYETASLGDAVGLTQFGVNIEKLLPSGMSSQRHWHANEDEFLYMLSGEAVLVEDGGETTLTEGDAVGWKAGETNAHHLINRTETPVYYIIVGTRAENDTVTYPDIDLHYTRADGTRQFTHKDGTPYPEDIDETAETIEI